LRGTQGLARCSRVRTNPSEVRIAVVAAASAAATTGVAVVAGSLCIQHGRDRGVGDPRRIPWGAVAVGEAGVSGLVDGERGAAWTTATGLDSVSALRLTCRT
jgi:hypothetical protein